MRLWIFFLLLFILVLAHLANLNPGNVTIYITGSGKVELPVIALFLLSMAFGGLLVILVSGTSEIKNLFLNWRSSRTKKREEKIQGLFIEATNSFHSGRIKKAMDLYHRLLDINPNHINTLLRLGDLYRIEKNYNEAVRLHKRARALDEQGVEAALSLALDLDEAKRHEEAIHVITSILKRDESNPAALKMLRDIYIRMERWEEAHHMQEQILKGNGAVSRAGLEAEPPLLAGLKYELGKRYFDKGNVEKAKRYFREALKLNKKFLPSYIGLGEILIQENNIKRAVALWEGAFKITRDIVLLHRLEDLCIEIDQPERVIEIYKSALKKYPNNQTLRFYLGKLYYRLEMVDDAFDLFTGLDMEGVRFADLHKLLGNLYLRKDSLVSAVDEFKKAMRFNKGLIIPYRCSSCGFQTIKWYGRCPKCGLWDSLDVAPTIEEDEATETIRLE